MLGQFFCLVLSHQSICSPFHLFGRLVCGAGSAGFLFGLAPLRRNVIGLCNRQEGSSIGLAKVERLGGWRVLVGNWGEMAQKVVTAGAAQGRGCLESGKGCLEWLVLGQLGRGGGGFNRRKQRKRRGEGEDRREF